MTPAAQRAVANPARKSSVADRPVPLVERFSVGTGLTGQAAFNKKTLHLDDATASEQFDPDIDGFIDEGYRSAMLVIPLFEDPSLAFTPGSADWQKNWAPDAVSASAAPAAVAAPVAAALSKGASKLFGKASKRASSSRRSSVSAAGLLTLTPDGQDRQMLGVIQMIRLIDTARASKEEAELARWSESEKRLAELTAVNVLSPILQWHWNERPMSRRLKANLDEAERAKQKVEWTLEEEKEDLQNAHTTLDRMAALATLCKAGLLNAVPPSEAYNRTSWSQTFAKLAETVILEMFEAGGWVCVCGVCAVCVLQARVRAHGVGRVTSVRPQYPCTSPPPTPPNQTKWRYSSWTNPSKH